MRNRGASLRGGARRAALAAALACALLPATAAASAPAGSEGLSPRLATLASSAELRAAPAAEQAEALSLPAGGPGSLLRQGSRLLAYVRFDGSAGAGAAALREAGAGIVDVSERYRTVTVAPPPALLPRLGELPGVAAVTEALVPVARQLGCAGAVRSEGDGQLDASAAREDFAVDGSGVTVGILSDSFDRAAGAPTRAAGDVASGDLPGPGGPCGSTPVGALDDTFVSRGALAPPSDEGRAMAQIVHDLAPGAGIDFATAYNGELGFAANIRRLAGAGAKVIVDDVSYLEEPFFQDGPVANAVAAAVGGGASYIAAAGNDNIVGSEGSSRGRDIASWEAPAFRPSACPPELEAELGAEDCMDFDPGAGQDPTFHLTVAPGAKLTVDLQWAEPWNGVRADLDAYLLDSGGDPLYEEDEEGNPVLDDEGQPVPVAGHTDNVASQKPVEVLGWENESSSKVTVNLAIDRCSGACNPGASPLAAPRLKFVLVQGRVTATEYPSSAGGDTVGPTIYGHAAGTAAIATGAVPYDNSATVEPYSSRGPVAHYFGPVAGATPAAATAVQRIAKPDLVASDCGANTFFGFRDPLGAWRFCGTSAAAPHAAAVAALVRQVAPGATPAQVRAALVSTARAVGGFSPDAAGAGLVDARAAVATLAPPPTVKITKGAAPLSRERRPSFEFSANRPVTFSCSLDGAPALLCGSPYTLPYGVADGEHGFAVHAVDRAGRAASSEVVHFRVDTHPPRARIARHPRKRVRTRKRRVRLRFRFRANERDVIFACKFDHNLTRFCRANVRRRFGPGKHVVLVRARDAAGNVQRRPTMYRFRVKRSRGHHAVRAAHRRP